MSALERLQLEAPNAFAAPPLGKHHDSVRALRINPPFINIQPLGPSMPRLGQKTDEELSHASSEALRGAVVGGAKVRISRRTSAFFRTIPKSWFPPLHSLTDTVLLAYIYPPFIED